MYQVRRKNTLHNISDHNKSTLVIILFVISREGKAAGQLYSGIENNGVVTSRAEKYECDRTSGILVSGYMYLVSRKWVKDVSKVAVRHRAFDGRCKRVRGTGTGAGGRWSKCRLVYTV